MSFYQIRVEDNNNKAIELEKYRGKILLIVNTATKCFFTPQYKGLNHLYQKYKDKGLEILDFPCNQFAKQAPGTNEEINEFCVKKYETAFPRFSKIEVNGKEESILYTYLKRHEKGLFKKDIKWNFTKFLVDRDGRVVKRYSPLAKPERIAKDIDKLLRQQ